MDKKESSASVLETTAPESCIKYFDAAWFCFSKPFTFFTLMDLCAAPTHQIQSYYIKGDWDPCQDTVSDLFRCLGGKTKLYKGAKPRPKPESIWTPRSKTEAQEFWHSEFSQVFESDEQAR